MGLLIRLVLLLGSLLGAGGFLVWALADLFRTAQEILLPFLFLSAAIFAAAVAYLVSSLRRR